jgi:PAS domain S-box-containing protein
MPIRDASWWHRPPAVLRYGAALAAVLASLVAIRVMDRIFEAAAHVSLLLAATMFGAWFGGLGPGLLALTLSTFGLAWDIVSAPAGADLAQLPRVVLFALSGLFVTWLTAAQRSTAESLRKARDDLHERALELARTNAALADEDAERRRAEYLMAQVFQSVPDGVAIIGSDYCYKRVNAAYERYFGMAPGKIVGACIADLVDADVFEVTRGFLDRCLAGEEVQNAGWWIRDPRERRYMAVTYTRCARAATAWKPRSWSAATSPSTCSHPKPCARRKGLSRR